MTRPELGPEGAGSAPLNQRWRTLQHITASPQQTGATARAALVLTHFRVRLHHVNFVEITSLKSDLLRYRHNDGPRVTPGDLWKDCA